MTPRADTGETELKINQNQMRLYAVDWREGGWLGGSGMSGKYER